MVGEIRDRETAEIAVQASLTGHLVLSRPCTPTAPSVRSPAWWTLGIEPFLLSSSMLACWPSAWCGCSARRARSPTAPTRPSARARRRSRRAADPASRPRLRSATSMAIAGVPVSMSWWCPTTTCAR
ncbi:ATPase, T2SS/T4P/T4SS family [Pseudomonas aeruginosa]